MNTEELKKLFEGTIRTAQNDVPMRKCDVCNMQRRQDTMINFAMMIGSPGHPDMPAFQCAHGEHWACSLAHLNDIMQHCLKEMMAICAMLHVNMHEQSDSKSVIYDEAKEHLERYNNNG